MPGSGTNYSTGDQITVTQGNASAIVRVLSSSDRHAHTHRKHSNYAGKRIRTSDVDEAWADSSCRDRSDVVQQRTLTCTCGHCLAHPTAAVVVHELYSWGLVQHGQVQLSVRNGWLHSEEPVERPTLGAEARNAIYQATQVSRLRPSYAAVGVSKVAGLPQPKASDVRTVSKMQARTGRVPNAGSNDNLHPVASTALGPQSGHSGPGRVIMYLRPVRYGGWGGQDASVVLYVLNEQRFHAWMGLADTLGSDTKVKLILAGGYVVVVICALL